MKKLITFLSSMFFTSILLVVFAVAIAYATFIENDYGTLTAKVLIYNAWWFDLLMVILCLNMIGSVIHYKLINRKKWSILLFHVAFIVIIIGAGITRYISFDGSMHIREGASSNQIISEETYVKIVAEANGEKVIKQKLVRFSPYSGNSFSESLEINGKKVVVRSNQFIPSATETMIEDETGTPAIGIVFANEQVARQDFVLELNETKHTGNSAFSFEAAIEGPVIKFKRQNDSLTFSAPDAVYIINMMGMGAEILPPGQDNPLKDKVIYQMGDMRFVVKGYYPKAKKQLIYVPDHEGQNRPDAFVALVSSGSESKSLNVFGRKGEIGTGFECDVNGVHVTINYGSGIRELEFSLKLEDFQLERYPGSNSPSSFASEVLIVDPEKQGNIPYRIFMNNILNYKGYRFFQSSYDQDEKGTILSVSHDWWGTAVSYFGYFLLTVGMILTLFNKNSRFKTIIRSSTKLRKLRAKALPILFLTLALTGTSYASNHLAKVDEDHVYEFGQLLVQDIQGRIEPVNTLASEVLRKISKENSWEGMSATEVFLLMNVTTDRWKNEAFIKVANPELKKMLGMTGSYTSYNSLVGNEDQGLYRLKDLVDEAYKKKPTSRNKLDKEIINVDERVNICIQIFNGEFLKAYPRPNDETHTWLVHEKFKATYDSLGKAFDEISLGKYFESVGNAINTGDWSIPNHLLDNIRKYQHEFGSKIVPSEQKVRLEIFYNEQNIFGNLAKACVFLGFLLLILHFVHIFQPNAKLGKVLFSAAYLIFILFIVYTIGLAIRWYISGHAPWSNGYETLIYIGWATLLSGFIFVKRAPITLAVTTILAALFLFVAGMSWMNPEVTPLVPVLKSYWLIIHVAVITASYGFLAIGALLGLINLVLIILRTEKNHKNISFTIQEIIYIIEMTLMIGLMMLTLGSFIGAIWANESWGRYWGWDPKETWALVTILVYAFILHLRKIPGMKSNLTFSSLALLGYGSVLMTFFGVNYYLSGMHSYAQGDPPPIPIGVYIAVFVVILVIVVASISERKSAQTNPIEELENPD